MFLENAITQKSVLSSMKGAFIGSQKPCRRGFQSSPAFCQPLLTVLTLQIWGSGLTPVVGGASSEGTRHQSLVSSPREEWLVRLLIQKQNLDCPRPCTGNARIVSGM